MRIINANLKEMKKKSGMSNKDIAEKSGISLSTVNRIMSGQTDIPNYQTICDLVIAMGGSLDELAGIEKVGGSQNGGSPEVYLAIIKDKDRIIAEKNAWLKRLFIVSCVLMAVIIGILIFDYTHPMIGFFRR